MIRQFNFSNGKRRLKDSTERRRGGFAMDLIYDKIVGLKNDCESAYEIMVFRGNRVEEFREELLANDGDLPTLCLYNESNCNVAPGARYRGEIDISLTKGGNTRVRQYLGINC